jgi:hypothetical protein
MLVYGCLQYSTSTAASAAVYRPGGRMEARCQNFSDSTVVLASKRFSWGTNVLRCARTLYVTHCARGVTSESERHRGFRQYCIRDVRDTRHWHKSEPSFCFSSNHGSGVVGGLHNYWLLLLYQPSGCTALDYEETIPFNVGRVWQAEMKREFFFSTRIHAWTQLCK